ncbi:MAG TPA: lipid-binding SYLF domain-containing protein [Terriglobales bacterium]|nr:lipid-binding SYLF domain-containing protein [Terriglobales bacterium]
MKRLAGLLLAVLLSVPAWAGDRENEVGRLNDAASILREIWEAPDGGVPERVMTSAKCVAVVPSMLKAGFGWGGSYGKGVATCRTETGAWSAPAFFQVKGGSFGLQIGGEAVDLVMIIMDDRGMQALLSSKFKLGADASVAAGPVGRHAEGMTDWKLRAQVLTYSRARGVFAGVSLNGAAIHQDKDATRDFYGRMVRFKTILTGVLPPPEGSAPFLNAVARYSTPEEKANEKTAAGGQ